MSTEMIQLIATALTQVINNAVDDRLRWAMHFACWATLRALKKG